MSTYIEGVKRVKRAKGLIQIDFGQSANDYYPSPQTLHVQISQDAAKELMAGIEAIISGQDLDELATAAYTALQMADLEFISNIDANEGVIRITITGYAEE